MKSIETSASAGKNLRPRMPLNYTVSSGNLKPLLNLLPESNLDVCESFSPSPLTECTFEEARHAWENGPMIWGGIPSPILEERTPDREFKEYVHGLLTTIGNQAMIIGVGDMVLGNNLIERVRYIAEQVEKRTLKLEENQSA